jgi:hypothetical protein
MIDKLSFAYGLLVGGGIVGLCWFLAAYVRRHGQQGLKP